MTSRLALVAAAATLFGAYSANAADLGGGCCADLEERVAELEATTARKGNRVVSLQVYGVVNKAILIWDDGFDDGATIVDNNKNGSDFGFTGSASLKPGWTAGYKVEINARSSRLGDFNQFDGPGDHRLDVDHSYLWVESEQLGRLSIGDTVSATDGIDDIILANTLSGRGTEKGSFTVLDSTGGDAGDLSEFVGAYTGQNDDLLRYDSPSLAGFILSASWVDLANNDSNDEQDFYDVALRYSGEFNAFRLAAGVGYSVLETEGDDDVTTVAGSISVMHVPTGLFAALSAGEQEDDGAVATKSHWHVIAGVEKNWFGYGATTVYGEYGEYDNFDFVNNEGEVIGAGVVQTFDSAAMDIYAQYRLYSFDDGGPNLSEEDLSTILIGSRIKF